jgi:hypothetical protein
MTSREADAGGRRLVPVGDVHRRLPPTRKGLDGRGTRETSPDRVAGTLRERPKVPRMDLWPDGQIRNGPAAEIVRQAA